MAGVFSFYCLNNIERSGYGGGDKKHNYPFMEQ